MARKTTKTTDDDERLEWLERLERTKSWVRGSIGRANALRSKDREFHGLDREFRYLQEQMLTEYHRSKDVRHPRDVGNIRETILRSFLTDAGYLPARYAVSDCSTRVASTTGHISREVDIALYDADNAIRLMRRGDDYEVLPVESVYGVIQVKSRLGRKELRDAFENLASFKRLRKKPARGLCVDGRDETNGFALLFAFEADLPWADIVAEAEAFAAANPAAYLTNSIVILDSGSFRYGSEELASVHNRHIEQSKDALIVHGRPDLEGQVLYGFQSILLGLLAQTQTSVAPFDDYHTLPLVAEGHSYRFRLGPFVEYGKCPKHGDYQRKIPSEKLAAMIAWCRTQTPKSSTEVLAQVLPETGNPVKDSVWVYNPDDLPLKGLLYSDFPDKNGISGWMIHDIIEVEDERMVIWLPWFYSARDQIITGCHKCASALTTKAKAKARVTKKRS